MGVCICLSRAIICIALCTCPMQDPVLVDQQKGLWCPEGHEVTHWTLLHMLWLQEANASVHLGLSLLPNI